MREVEVGISGTSEGRGGYGESIGDKIGKVWVGALALR